MVAPDVCYSSVTTYENCILQFVNFHCVKLPGKFNSFMREGPMGPLLNAEWDPRDRSKMSASWLNELSYTNYVFTPYTLEH